MNCIVVDDEPLARTGMAMLIEKVPYLKLKGMFANAMEADDFMRNNHVDLVFLDIQMPGLNGMDYLKSATTKAHIVLTTAYPQFAVEAFELHVDDYLVKPVRFERFFKTVSRIAGMPQGRATSAEQENSFVFIRTDRKFVKVHFSDIEYIEGLKDYVTIYCNEGRHVMASNLKTIYSKLPSNLFLRVNKSFIVNMSRVRTIDNDYVSISSRSIPIGDNFKQDVTDFINQNKLLKG
jgi:DNA-binding LytR/AlgR family response regulator